MPQRFGRESVWVAAMTLLGAGVRLKGLGTIGLDQFDEGIYAQAATWILAEGGLLAIDPGLIPYAPPGYPVLVGLAYAAIGPSGTAAILVSILFGVMTIPILAWISRRTFGRGAGAATASLVALAGPHLVFSRTGLTDATFLFAWSLAMLSASQFLDRPNGWRAMRLGLFVGLAQLVKYNGWMTGAIVIVAVAAGAVRPGDGRRSAGRSIALGLSSAAVAVLVYLPWFLFVERTTGYVSLLSHHRSYVDGLTGWWPNWRQQTAQVVAMEGIVTTGITWAGVAAAMAWLGAAVGQGRSNRSWGNLRRLGPLAGLLLAVLSLASPPNLAWWLALAWSSFLLVDRRPSARFLACWFLIMAASTPLYHPYSRLWLPTLAASWVASGGLIAGVLSWLRSEPTSRAAGPGPIARRLDPEPLVMIFAVVLATIGPMLLPAPVRRFPSLLTASNGLRDIAERLQSPPGPGPGVPNGYHLYARPALRFYLRRSGAGVIRTHADVASILSAAPGPGEVAVLDAGQGVTEDDAAAISRNSAWRLRTAVSGPASIPTVLDVRPDCVYNPSGRQLGPASPPPRYSRGFKPRLVVDPTCTFWIFDAP